MNICTSNSPPSPSPKTLTTNTVSEIVTADFNIGAHIKVIDEKYAWDLYDYPKIVNYRTGKVEDKIEEIFTGKQVSSIVYHLDNLPKITFNNITKQVAILNGDKLEILTK